MIVFDLVCADHGHRFEGWFGSSAEFEGQQARGLVSCPQCGSASVSKAPMAPAVPRKGNQAAPQPSPQSSSQSSSRPAPPPVLAGGSMPPEALAVMTKLAELQAEAIKQSEWVGDKFADVSRAMHYGEQDQAAIYGQASAEEAQALVEEGIPVLPLLFPVAPPEKLN